ncbi:DUF6435 family protein [Rubinisphaera brasiliensis]|uniref:Lacal_2735 family protein n=1 Tax=Rubinisphaera brasiliensis (strain ATCC 49424 / DSM 5305 / JCM 21570 / IAM 15109 / NBRC 103401 / IFAM 1448) TaxID=756272 RepID=F0SI33_RUBBR|nr:DUF6435 family protein [Rubinisphaera brasiliensis]ADY61735.1 hypothetical protein Plabr_4161 [Rubinisphaera brasiliensis DSM 5305]
MFGLFRKDSVKKRKAEYARLLEEARDLQRHGDIQGFAKKTAAAEELWKSIEELEASGE